MDNPQDINKAADGRSALTDVLGNHRLLNEMLSALEIAQKFCGKFTAEVCPDTVAIPISMAVANGRKALGKCYFAQDGTLTNADGTRSIFDDVDA